jgi:hypothetical protein
LPSAIEDNTHFYKKNAALILREVYLLNTTDTQAEREAWIERGSLLLICYGVIMMLTRKEQALIRSYEIRLAHATNMAEVYFCKSQISSILEKAKSRLN